MTGAPPPEGQEPTGKVEVGAEMARRRQERTTEEFRRSRETHLKLPFLDHKSQRSGDGTSHITRSGVFKLTGGVLLTGAIIVGLFVGYQTVGPGNGGGNDSQVTTTVPPTSAGPSSTSASPTTTTAPSSTTRTGTTSSGAAPASGPITYKLTALRSVTWNNGFYDVNNVRIGSMTFPASIVGNYQSSTSDQNNKAVWAIAGQCSVFDVWVGKDVDSGYSGSTPGRFVVMADGRELDSQTLGPNDPPYHWQLDITGVNRLTIYDTRGTQDMSNAWGTPQITCSGSPGPAR